MRKISRRPLRFLVAVYIAIIFVVVFASGKSLLVLSSPPASGDWVVAGAESYYDEVIVLNGNLIVRSSGNLTFRKVTLKMNCTYSGQYNITVESGGKFYVLEDSVITSAEPDKRIGFFEVCDDTTFRMSNSALHECGWAWLPGSDGLHIWSDDAVVENSLISHNWVGIWVHSNGAIVRNNNVTANDGAPAPESGIVIHPSCNPAIYNNYISWNNGAGITIGAYASPTIYNNTVTSNSGVGIHGEPNANPIIQNNIITRNGFDGIAMQGCNSSSTISNNMIAENLGNGIKCNDYCSSTIVNNTVTSNLGNGIFCLNHSDAIIHGNTITNNNSTGILCYENSNPTIEGNIITSNIGWGGIGVFSSSPVIVNNTVTSNTSGIALESEANPIIQDNIITLNNHQGIFFQDRCNPTIRGNMIAENFGGGIISLHSCSPNIINNTITSNIGPGHGISCYNHSHAIIQGNTIKNITQGHAIALNLHCTGIIQGNMITNNLLGIGSGLHSNPLIQGNIITSNWDAGIHCADNSLPEVHWNDIYGNGVEVGNDDSSVTVNATHNYWGDGPSISGDVLATPWLTESIFHAEITSPLSGETVASTITVSTEAHAHSEVHKVEFYIDNELEYTDYDTSYEWNWDTTQYAETEHEIKAKAYDMLGLKTSTSITVFVDNTDPAVSIKEPTPQSTYSGTVRISVNATDNRELANVHVKVDNTEWLVMTYNSTDLLWKYNLNTTTLSDGQHTLMILALDEASNPATTSTPLFIDNTPPTLTIQTPQSGTTVGMTLSVEIQASDASGISRIEFYLQDVLVHTDHDTPYEWLWDTTQYPNGAYTITVKAYD
ncbi:MAG: right-handed parallel beta-helix repeat-containing protein, partial [Candidatus Bathyarchaeota archaeon]|nr:right-handed parallel beta-helix repeat-containing protein [Candidatus Bathyarchaeota archaeon]